MRNLDSSAPGPLGNTSFSLSFRCRGYERSGNMSATVARAKCSLCDEELRKHELPRPDQKPFCDRCLRANQTRPESHGSERAA